MADYELCRVGVVRRVDGASIPNDVRNRDWRAYQAWLGEGNVPDPDPNIETTTPESSPDAVKRRLRDDPLLIALVKRIAAKEGITAQEVVNSLVSQVS